MAIHKIILRDRHGRVIASDSFATMESAEVTIENGVGTPSASADYDNGVLSIIFRNVKGDGIQSLSQVEASDEDGGTNTWKITTESGSEFLMSVNNGHRGNGIESIEQTASSIEDNGVNEWTITETDGKTTIISLRNGSTGTEIESVEPVSISTESDGINTYRITTNHGDTYIFATRNGSKGDTGDSAVYDPDAPDTPDFVMANAIGWSTTKAMTQKAVTEALISENTVSTWDVDVEDVVDTIDSDTSGSTTIATEYGNCLKGKWISSDTYNSKSNAVMFMMPRSVLGDSDKVKIAAQTYSRMAFLKNNTAGFGSPAPYCDGTSIMVFRDNAIELLNIPIDCKFIYFDYSYDGVSRLPSEIKGICTYKSRLHDVEDKVEEMVSADIVREWDVDVADIIDTIDSDTSGESPIATDYGNWLDKKFINGTYVANNKAQMFMMPRTALGDADVLKVVSQSLSRVAFLKNNVAGNGTTPSYCDGCDLVILRDTTVSLDIPKDCKYIYFDYKYDGVMRFPKEIKGIDTVKSRLLDVEGRVEDSYTATRCTKLTGSLRARVITPAMTTVEGYSYVFPVTPCQKIFIAGAANFVWLKTSVIQLGSDPFDASNYFHGWCECDSEGATLYAAPDAHYLMVEGVDGDVDVYGYDEYKDFSAHGTDLVSLISYVANRCIRYEYHTYIRTMHGGGYKAALTGIGSDNEHSHRNPAVLASHLETMLYNDQLDLGLIGTTKYALRNQIIRYIEALVDSHSLWANKWQSSITANNIANSACRLYRDGYMTEELYNDVLDVLIAEADNILNKNVGDRWADNHVFGIYWKNAAGTELYNGDSKSEEVGWYGACLGTAYALCPDAPNADAYRNKFIEFAVISHAAPSDIGVDKSINGYSLTNLQGSNITDDGIIINHGIIHPDYMTSRTSCIFGCLRALGYAGLKIPKALLFNMSKVLHGFIDYEFTSEKYLGKYQPFPPYGVIIADGADNPYFPQGNDWGTVRQTAEISYLTEMYALCQSPRYDCSRSAIIYLMTIKKLQDRFETAEDSGRIILDTTENSYSTNMKYTNVGSAFPCAINGVRILTRDIVWTDEDWYITND